jgi:hypothetical protein
MPMILQEIDEIARQLGRDVLFVSPPIDDDWITKSAPGVPQKLRSRIRAYLRADGIAFTACFGPSIRGLILRPYRGEMHIDIPNDPADERYRQVCSFFENSDGSPRFRNAILYLLTIEEAVAMAPRVDDER